MAREQYYSGEYKGHTAQHGYETTESMCERAKENRPIPEPYDYNKAHFDSYPPASPGATVQAERKVYMPKELGMGYGLSNSRSVPVPSPFTKQLAYIHEALNTLDTELAILFDKLERVMEQGTHTPPNYIPEVSFDAMEQGVTTVDQEMINIKVRVNKLSMKLVDLSSRVVI